MTLAPGTKLGPRSMDAWQLYAFSYLMPMRRLEEALAAQQKAWEIDPLSPIVHVYLGSIYTLMGQYDRGIEQFRNALELDPHSVPANGLLAYAHIAKGELNEGIRILEANAHLRDPLFQAYLGYACAIAGRTGEAHQMLEQLQSAARTAYAPAWSLAMIYLGLGETDKAFDWLEKGLDERSSWVVTLRAHPIWEPLRSHPRYRALLRKMNLEA